MPLGNPLPNTIRHLEQVSRESSKDMIFLRIMGESGIASGLVKSNELNPTKERSYEKMRADKWQIKAYWIFYFRIGWFGSKECFWVITFHKHNKGDIFLLFFHPHASHQVTINASTQALTFVHDIRPKKKNNSNLLFTRPNVPVFSSANFSSSFSVFNTINIKSKRHGWHEDFGDKLIRMCLNTTYFAENWKIYLRSAYFVETKNFLLKVL